MFITPWKAAWWHSSLIHVLYLFSDFVNQRALLRPCYSRWKRKNCKVFIEHSTIKEIFVFVKNVAKINVYSLTSHEQLKKRNFYITIFIGILLYNMIQRYIDYSENSYWTEVTRNNFKEPIIFFNFNLIY